MTKIIMFYGAECPHCHSMLPIVEQLQKELNFELEKLEVWHNEDNSKKMRQFEKIIRPACGGEFGVPAFINEEKKSSLCGEISEEEFKKWIQNN